MTEIPISRVIGHAVLATIAWMIFGFTSRSFLDARAPRANIIGAQHRTINGLDVTIVEPTEQEMKHANPSLPFMTREELNSKLADYRQRRVLFAAIAVVSALATFWFGCSMGDSWRYGLASVLFGPLAVSYFMYR